MKTHILTQIDVNIRSSFLSLDGSARTLLVDCLCSNFSVLTASIATLLTASKNANLNSDLHDSLHAYKNALKLYVFFLEWIFCDAEKESKALCTASGSSGRTKGKNTKTVAGWDWDFHREKVVRPIAAAVDLDLKLLFIPNYKPDEDLLQLFCRLTFTVLGSVQAIKSKELKQHLCSLVGATALKYGQLEGMSNGLVDLLNKHEHVPVVISEVVADASRRYDDSRLAELVLRSVGNVDPAEYKAQQQADAAGVRNVAAFIGDIAGRLPHVVANCMASLMPHLGGEAYALRSALVTAMGRLISGAFSDVAGATSTSVQQAKLKSKQALLDALVERARDVSSYTRSRVLQTWAQLAEERAIPLSHWLLVTELGSGRLEDKSANVRKAALQLLESLLQFNPFSPELSVDTFKPSLDEYSGKLEAIAPKEEMDVCLPEDDNDAIKVIEAQEKAAEIEREEQQNAKDSANQAVRDAGLEGGIESLRVLVASLSAAVKFSELLSGAIPYLEQLLASSTASDSTESMALIILMKQFNVDNSESAVLKILPLIFSRDPAIKDAVVASTSVLWLSADARTSAQQLSLLPMCTTLGELTSLEEIICELVRRKQFGADIIRSLWAIASSENDASPLERRGALLILSMSAKSEKKVLAGKLDVLLHVGFSEAAKEDPVITKASCSLLRALAPTAGASHVHFPLKADHAAFSHLAQLLTASPLPEAGWYAVAEEAIATIYALHPHPETLVEAVLQGMAAYSFVETEDGHADASSLSRLLFVLGQSSIQHLVYIEGLTKAVRSSCMAREQNGQCDIGNPTDDGEEEDIGAQIGLGGNVAQDMELDALKEKLEAQMVSGENLLGKYASIAEWVCLQLSREAPSRPQWTSSASLRSSAVLALSKLMIIHQSFCEKNLQLLFTIMQRTEWIDVKCNVVVALGDLAFRYPNLLEPWTHHMYVPLKDSHVTVRKHALMVLTHLILNDMMKVKGYISDIAECLEDDDQRIVALTKLFFHELAQRGHSPIYNLLPDILSRLSASTSMSQASFQKIMKYLLGFITKDKQVESIVEKLCTRFSCCEDTRRARDLAFCLSQLSISEKGLKILSEAVKSYTPWLGDEEVWSKFQVAIQKAKKWTKPEVRASIEEFEERLAAIHVEQHGYKKTEDAAASTSSGSRGEQGHSASEVENRQPVVGNGAESTPFPLDECVPHTPGCQAYSSSNTEKQIESTTSDARARFPLQEQSQFA